MTIQRARNPAKDFLQSYRSALIRRASLERSVRELRESLTGTTQAITGDPVTGGGSDDRMADTVAKIADLETEITDQLAELRRTIGAILAAICAVPDETQRAVLTLRYVEGLSWPDIQEQVGYERTQIYVIHGRALVAVNDWMISHDV